MIYIELLRWQALYRLSQCSSPNIIKFCVKDVKLDTIDVN